MMPKICSSCYPYACRADNTLAQGIPRLYNIDDLTTLMFRAIFVGDGFMQVGVEIFTISINGFDAISFKCADQFSIDQIDAFRPNGTVSICRAILVF